MPLHNEVIFVSGMRGSGKSYWTKKHALKLPRCLIFDSLGEYGVDKGRRFYDLDSMVDFLIADEKRPILFRAAYDTAFLNDDFSLFCRMVLSRGNMYLIIEEIDLFCKPLGTEPEFLRLLKYGRHYGIQIIGVSRRPAEVSRDFTSNATRFIIFGQKEPRDIQYFRSIIGDDALKIPNLDKYHYLDCDFTNDGQCQIMPPV